jgi:hypothetical protein
MKLRFNILSKPAMFSGVNEKERRLFLVISAVVSVYSTRRFRIKAFSRFDVLTVAAAMFSEWMRKTAIIFNYICRRFGLQYATFSNKKLFRNLTPSQWYCYDSRLVRCYGVLLGEQLPTFRRGIMPLFSWQSCPRRLAVRSFKTPGTANTLTRRRISGGFLSHEAICYVLSCDVRGTRCAADRRRSSFT